jgi:hypothetical protein
MSGLELKANKAACNSTYKKLAVQCSADTFVVAESFVLRMKICSKKLPTSCSCQPLCVTL